MNSSFIEVSFVSPKVDCSKRRSRHLLMRQEKRRVKKTNVPSGYNSSKRKSFLISQSSEKKKRKCEIKNYINTEDRLFDVATLIRALNSLSFRWWFEGPYDEWLKKHISRTEAEQYISTFGSCNCCEEHGFNFPPSLSEKQPFLVETLPLQKNRKSCDCPCRHHARCLHEEYGMTEPETEAQKKDKELTREQFHLKIERIRKRLNISHDYMAQVIMNLPTIRIEHLAVFQAECPHLKYIVRQELKTVPELPALREMLVENGPTGPIERANACEPDGELPLPSAHFQTLFL
jgi:hypothetical protein